MDTTENTLELPPGWTARPPDERDIAALAQLRATHSASVIGSAEPDVATVMSEVIGTGSWTRRQRVVLDADGRIRAWTAVHDRAAGRTLVGVSVDPRLPDAQADPLAAGLFDWAERAMAGLVSLRGLDVTQLDSGAYASDERQRRWLSAAGYHQARTWLQMSRPVAADEPLPGPREGVSIRRVRQHTNGLPVSTDVQLVHRMLEESFADHFNSYRESFPEFISRLREDPRHSWDQWWLAFVDIDGQPLPAGAVVSSALAPDAAGIQGSYVDYIGVNARARGRGVAKSLLYAVLTDAAAKGRDRVGLEVDADSPTHADGIYRSLRWETSYVTESWHRSAGPATRGVGAEMIRT